jgi:hypothetical protein
MDPSQRGSPATRQNNYPRYAVQMSGKGKSRSHRLPQSLQDAMSIRDAQIVTKTRTQCMFKFIHANISNHLQPSDFRTNNGETAVVIASGHYALQFVSQRFDSVGRLSMDCFHMSLSLQGKRTEYKPGTYYKNADSVPHLKRRRLPRCIHVLHQGKAADSI